MTAAMREGNGAAERHDRVQRYVPPLNEGTLPPTFGPAAALPQNGEPRRTLHLSLSKTVLTMLIHSTKIPTAEHVRFWRAPCDAAARQSIT